MKVYVVLMTDAFEEAQVIGVYAKEELAENACEKYNNDFDGRFDVRPFDLIGDNNE